MSLLLCLGFILNTAPAKAEDTHHLVYEVYAGGIHAVQAKVDLNFNTKGRYSAFVGAKTRGFLGSLVPWHGTFESEGWVEKDGRYAPQHHKSIATWRGVDKTKDYLYNRDGSFKSLTVFEGDQEPEKKEIADKVTNGTTDILSATMEVMKFVGSGGDCSGTSEVFDGKRRFEQKFVHQKHEDLKPTKYNIFDGRTAVCTVEVKPINGEWSKKPRGWLSIQEQGRKRGTMPTVWMGTVHDGDPAVPVKILVKTAYGALFMHLAEYRKGDAVKVAEKRVLEEDE